ncbi:30S ribosomal protein S1, chloroplastic [Tetrabaena socialis]|uniref:30S ribosomal protein S1, chloroplastic n=1 Tax=Tetrabaena socialis TaxID=47790 RepID=A0A2J8AGC1_9CHLO|nr:30S ribosomal protein S1, chloroplastic [Tetrabaena socialis]|eukprot:PNH11552.1 30S ribosomal protein S1, chloroplastic [Tetrabaena socialis]
MHRGVRATNHPAAQQNQAPLPHQPLLLPEGDLVAGVVQSVEPAFGAYIELAGGVPALLHISQVSHERVELMESIFKTGDPVKALVRRAQGRSRGCMQLTTKALELTPGDMIRDPQLVYDTAEETAAALRSALPQAGEVVKGVVLAVKEFGAFVDVGWTEGLLGRRNISHKAVDRVAAVLKAGDQVKAYVLRCDGPGRVELSTKMLEATPGDMLRDPQLVYDKAEETIALRNSRIESFWSQTMVGTVVAGVVQSVKPCGAVIDLGGVTGLLRRRQISHERVFVFEKIVQEGNTIKVMILSQNRKRGRVTLSTKKLEPTPGDMLRDPQLVYDKAEETAKMYRMKRTAEAAASAAKVQPDTSNQQGISDDGLNVH